MVKLFTYTFIKKKESLESDVQLRGKDFSTPPVHVNEEIEVEIVSMGSKGDGVAKIKGYVLMIPGAQMADKVKVRIRKVTPRIGFADLVEVPV